VQGAVNADVHTDDTPSGCKTRSTIATLLHLPPCKLQRCSCLQSAKLIASALNSIPHRPASSFFMPQRETRVWRYLPWPLTGGAD
jgi:hypothetical protein